MSLALAIVFACVEEPLPLKYAFKPGFKAKYIKTVTTTTTISGGKQPPPPPISLEVKAAVLWRVKRIEPSGAANVSQTVTRLRIKNKTGDHEGVVDTGKEDNPKDLKDLSELMAKSETKLLIWPDGEILTAEVAPILEDRLEEFAGGKTSMTAELLLHMAQDSTVRLPSKPVRIGDQWRDLAFSKRGQVESYRRLTFNGLVDDKGGKLLKCTLTMLKESPVPSEKKDVRAGNIEIKAASGDGTLLFDPKTCWLVKRNESIDMTVSVGTGADRIEITTKGTVEEHLKEDE